MTEAIGHRGPDGAGLWEDPVVGVGLGHRRLAILDLSPAGAQPMIASSGRWVLTFNGEIYNFRELRSTLEGMGHRFRGSSDTEVILAAVDAWGVSPAVRQLNGIFACALWDRSERKLYLFRDHLGVKPLYIGHVGSRLVFGSELHAIRRVPGFDAAIDREAIAQLMRFNCIPAPRSIYHGIRKVMPGTILSIGADGKLLAEEVYWSVKAVAEAGVADPLQLTDREATDALETALVTAIRRQMVSDVPVGAFLSGGIDSSTVVSLMQRVSSYPVKTFSIGSTVAAFDEAGHARRVSGHLGTEHTELIVSEEEARAVIPRLPMIYDEPFADASQIPTFLVAQLARQSVTVSLSGDGGDELFAGYNRHVLVEQLWGRLRSIPHWTRRAMAAAILAIPPQVWDRQFGSLLRRTGVQSAWRLHKLAEVIDASSRHDMYARLVSHWPARSRIVPDVTQIDGLVDRPTEWARLPTFTEAMMFVDFVTYLPDDILTKVDRASMAVALEARVPLLDPRLVEFAWRIPLHQKLRDGHGKWLLRQVLYRHCPPALIDRPKAGFGVPVGVWLRGPLREWAESLLDPARVGEEGFFDVSQVRARWHEHLTGQRDHEYLLWNVLMFQAWHAATHG
jgi:asparagine synthase (glutamine-hydrolysing)